MIALLGEKLLSQAEEAVLRRHLFRLTGSQSPAGHNKSSNLDRGPDLAEGWVSGGRWQRDVRDEHINDAL
jgi:hypothetical protein